ncbi:uncharacterized protein DNG_03439 [Cephalotrichum gorgonifer]|uniref:Coenzyme Q-binding protein COQ10 START domain-containing protein n=1 Tax=Cephalotrichum gorgonifer TaxID=2041049 RepID=A0AAE8MVB0_9PEZI|nr:uncharacterized protein DNG_03439 [Cephalotrichum gorgonifer]
MPPRVLLPARALPRAAAAGPRRPFITLPRTSPQTLSANRYIPYPSAALYEIIADIDSYSSFVPYCSASTVTRLSAPDASGRRWPTVATLRVGWGGFEEEFTSRVTCVPSSLVEARSGEAAGPGSGASSVLKSLVTRWSFAPGSLRFEFANPVYAAVSAAVSETVAKTMIEAFEAHARKVLGEKGGRVGSQL